MNNQGTILSVDYNKETQKHVLMIIDSLTWYIHIHILCTLVLLGNSTLFHDIFL